MKTSTKIRATKHDRKALNDLRNLIPVDISRRQRDLDKYQPGAVASCWSFVPYLVSNYKSSRGLTYSRIDRLVALGMLDKRASDGSGYLVRLKD